MPDYGQVTLVIYRYVFMVYVYCIFVMYQISQTNVWPSGSGTTLPLGHLTLSTVLSALGEMIQNATVTFKSYSYAPSIRPNPGFNRESS